MSQTIMDWEGERAPKITEIWMLERNKNSCESWWFSKSKSRKSVKQMVPKTLFFSVVCLNRFWIGLGSVWGRFWGRFGSFLASLGPLLASFCDACILNALQEGVLQAPGLDFSSILKGLGEVRRGFWKGFAKLLLASVPTSQVLQNLS